MWLQVIGSAQMTQNAARNPRSTGRGNEQICDHALNLSVLC